MCAAPEGDFCDTKNRTPKPLFLAIVLAIAVVFMVTVNYALQYQQLTRGGAERSMTTSLYLANHPDLACEAGRVKQQCSKENDSSHLASPLAPVFMRSPPSLEADAAAKLYVYGWPSGSFKGVHIFGNASQDKFGICNPWARAGICTDSGSTGGAAPGCRSSEDTPDGSVPRYRSMFSSELLLAAMAVRSSRITLNASEATMFLIPTPVTCLAHSCLDLATTSGYKQVPPSVYRCGEYVWDAVLGPLLQRIRNTPQWDRRQGSDHVMAFGHGAGAALLDDRRSHSYHFGRMVFVQVGGLLPSPKRKGGEDGGSGDATGRRDVDGAHHGGSGSGTEPDRERAQEQINMLESKHTLPNYNGYPGRERESKVGWPWDPLDVIMPYYVGQARNLAAGFPDNAPFGYNGVRGKDLTSASYKQLALFAGGVMNDRQYSGGARQALVTVYGDGRSRRKIDLPSIAWESGGAYHELQSQAEAWKRLLAMDGAEEQAAGGWGWGWGWGLSKSRGHEGARFKGRQCVKSHQRGGLGGPILAAPRFQAQAYVEEIRRSRFLLAPEGWMPWTPRPVEAALQGVPVALLGRPMKLPGHGWIDWRALSVQVRAGPEGVSALECVLRGVTERTHASMRNAAARAGVYLSWAQDPALVSDWVLGQAQEHVRVRATICERERRGEGGYLSAHQSTHLPVLANVRVPCERISK